MNTMNETFKKAAKSLNMSVREFWILSYRQIRIANKPCESHI